MRILFLPAVHPSRGFGHLHRCMEAARAVGGRLWAPEGRPSVLPEDLWAGSDAPNAAWDLVVFDRMRTETALFRRFADRGIPLVGWDEGAQWRRRMDFLIDSLGNLRAHRPNLRWAGVMDLGTARPLHRNPIHRVLVAFGGSDSAKLAERLMQGLEGLPDPGWTVELLEGPFQDRQGGFRVWGRDVGLLRRPERLRDHLSHYDLVFCSYGITAHECLHQGVPILMVEPTAYHARLSRRQGWPVLGVRGVSARALRRLVPIVSDPERRPWLYPASGGDGPEAPHLRDPHAVWRWWRPLARRCPACGSVHARVVHRQGDRTFFRCRGCGLLYLFPWLVPEKDYGPSYFEQEYRDQYGRTYLEDFPAIRAQSHRRLSVLERLAGPLGGRRLLDLGCAFGPFLQAAHERGLEVEGADLNPGAVEHVQRVLGLTARQVDLGTEGWERVWEGVLFDVVSLWYVIEHFPDLEGLRRGLRALVRPGGWLLLSTPNAAGLTARFHPERFFAQSPTDHFTLWTPRAARRLLRRWGFRVVRIEPTGIHPRRLFGKALPRWVEGAIAAGQRGLGWGDTMEIYARRDP